MRVLALFLLLPLIAPLYGASGLVPVPPLSGRVVDQTGSLSAGDQRALDAQLAAFEARKGSQVAVLILPTTQPEAIEQYSIRVAEQWKLGRKKVDDGAILVVAKDDRALRLEVGYGLEGALTDAMSKRIISDIITPYFRSGDFGGGIRAGVESILKVIDGEPLPAPPARRPRGGGGFGGLGVQGLFGIFVAAMVLTRLLNQALGRVRGGAVSGGIVGALTWLLAGSLVLGAGAGLLAFLFAAASGGGSGGGFGPSGGLRGARRGPWDSGGWGGGGFGGGGGWGGGGGGFSGGGGGFGGGGASGRW
jgi:uncharacterized protein